MSDNLQADSTTHEVKWFYHFAPDLTVEQQNRRVLVKNDAASFSIDVNPPAEVKLSIEMGEFSSNYGRKQPNQILIATWQGAVSEMRFVWKFERNS
ncbi:MAG: hypothetical protein F9K46_10540 [Anaerolineae bacterium]|nr:MAG: hypothetical protein F9K46_10540 [Anaerolineae bacterium]